MNRKLRKLLTSPALFFSDMYRKRMREVRRRVPRVRTVRSTRRYTVIAAVYGVEAYLDDFFRSLTRQSLDFEHQIEVILVDDGSPDDSASVIASWKRRYPRSIHYVRKSNGGQASARNLGLERATGDWITFIDPDDLVEETYFQRVDELLSRKDARDVVLVGCRMVHYRDGVVLDNHALRSQFADGDNILPVNDRSTHLQLSAASAFFRRDLLIATGRRFDEQLRPVFEDAHFVGRYLLDIPRGAIGVCAKATYYYRKRQDASSTVDRSWRDPGRFGAVIERGYLDLLRTSAASSGGRAASWVQRTVVYDLLWHLGVIADHPEILEALEPEVRVRYRELLKDCLREIDDDLLFRFDLARCDYGYRVGCLGVLKRSRPSRQRIFIDSFDDVNRTFRLRYFHHGDREREEITLDGVPVEPTVHKTRYREFLGEDVVCERIHSVRADHDAQELAVSIGGEAAEIKIPGSDPRLSVNVQEIAQSLDQGPRLARAPRYVRAEHALARSPVFRRRFDGCLLFMDRDSQADDNAEHLYRYVLRTRPDLRAYFVLREGCRDWDRLEREGFRLISFGSLEHRMALINARHLISSHADNYVLAFPRPGHRRTLQRSRFTFLQHGVIKDDLSGWLNGKAIHCFVTASPAEYASIVEDGPYEFTAREVVLTGLPRHDALGAGAPQPERVLLIMPTWRRWLAGKQVGKSAVRVANPEFYTSDFALRWKRLLHSPVLRDLVLRYGFQVQFFPHANLDPYLDWFDVPSFVEPLSNQRGASMQDAFRRAAVLLTDYSSTAFDMAYLRRAVLYYQFDRERTFGGGHTTRRGYFEYERDGFGPVCSEEATVLAKLEGILSSNGAPDPEYLTRMDATFAFRDGKACERTLEAILCLDRAR